MKTKLVFENENGFVFYKNKKYYVVDLKYRQVIPYEKRSHAFNYLKIGVV